MSASIELKDRTILETSAGVFETIFHEISEILSEKELITNDEFDLFMEKLNYSALTLGGVCIDIGKIFKNPEKLELLISLLELTIEKIKYQLKDSAVERLWKFHGELAKYKEELEAQGK